MYFNLPAITGWLLMAIAHALIILACVIKGADPTEVGSAGGDRVCALARPAGSNNRILGPANTAARALTQNLGRRRPSPARAPSDGQV